MLKLSNLPYANHLNAQLARAETALSLLSGSFPFTLTLTIEDERFCLTNKDEGLRPLIEQVFRDQIQSSIEGLAAIGIDASEAP